MISFLFVILNRCYSFVCLCFDKYKQYDPYIIQPISPDFDPIQNIIKLRVPKCRLLRPIQEIRMLIVQAEFSK